MKRMGLLVLAAGLAIFARPAQAGWTSAIRLTWNSGLSVFPDMASDPFGHLHVVWVDTTPGNEEIYYKKSPDGGVTWTTTKRLTTTPGSSGGPSITADSSGNPHVVWYDNTLGNREIYYMKSTDGGATWTTAKRLTWTADNSWDPAIAAGSSGKLYLVWYEETPGTWNIYFKCGADGGTTWTTNKRLTWTAGDSLWPSIAVDSSGHIHVVWSHNPPSMPLEIYYRKSTDGGGTWGSAQRLTSNSADSEYPAIAVDTSGNPHLVWGDSMLGDWEIYHKKYTK